MSSVTMGLLGAVIIIGAVFLLWFGRLQERANIAVHHEGANEPEAGQNEGLAFNPYSLKLGAPDSAIRRVQEPIEDLQEEIESSSASAETATTLEAPLEDCPMAGVNLSIAQDLAMVGDFEGVAEVAALVLESPQASARQKIKAKELVRQTTAA